MKQILQLLLAFVVILTMYGNVSAQTINLNDNYKVNQQIYYPNIQSTSTVKPGLEVGYAGAKGVVLKPGFKATAGSEFTAWIEQGPDGLGNATPARLTLFNAAFTHEQNVNTANFLYRPSVSLKKIQVSTMVIARMNDLNQVFIGTLGEKRPTVGSRWIKTDNIYTFRGDKYYIYKYKPKVKGEIVSDFPDGALVFSPQFSHLSREIECEHKNPFSEPTNLNDLEKRLKASYQVQTDGTTKLLKVGVERDVIYASDVKAPKPVEAGLDRHNGRISEGLIKLFSETLGSQNKVFDFAVTTGYAESGQSTYNRDLKMDVYYPKLKTGKDVNSAEPLPVIVYVYGGAFIWNSWRAPITDLTCRWLASQGFVVAAIDYRLGMDVDENPEIAKRAVYRATVDSRRAVTYWRENTVAGGKWRTRADKVFMSGHSAGAITTLHNLFLDENERMPSTYAGYPFQHRIERIDWWCLFRQVMPESINTQTKEIQAYVDNVSEIIRMLKSFGMVPDNVSETLSNVDAWVNGTCQSLVIERKNTFTDELTSLNKYPHGRADAGATFSGAIGDLNWLNNNSPVMLVHHQKDAIVPFAKGAPFDEILTAVKKTSKLSNQAVKAVVEAEKELSNPILWLLEQPELTGPWALGADAVDILKKAGEQVTLIIADDLNETIQDVKLPVSQGSKEIKNRLGLSSSLAQFPNTNDTGGKGARTNSALGWWEWFNGLPGGAFYHYPQTKKGVAYKDTAPQLSINDNLNIFPKVRDFFRGQAYSALGNGNTEARIGLELPIEAPSIEQPVSMYPNPTTVKLNILLGHDEPAMVEVYDLTGVLNQTLKNDSGNSRELVVSMDGLKSGIYIVRVILSDTTYTQKIIKE